MIFFINQSLILNDNVVQLFELFKTKYNEGISMSIFTNMY